MNGKVTLLIPTYNRPEYLARTLHFLKVQKSCIPIIVADGSGPDEAQKNRQVCKDYGDELDYFHLPSPSDSAGAWQNFFERYLKAVDRVKTGYVATCADDDLLIISSILRCAEFLDKHPDFVACHGVYLHFRYLTGGITVDGFEYHGLSIDGAEAGARLIQLHARYESPFYAVIRTDTQRAILPKAFQMPHGMFVEVHHATLAVLTGKIERLGEIYCLRNKTIPPHAREFDEWYQWLAKDIDRLLDYYRNHRKGVIDYALSLPNRSLDAATCSNAMDMAFILYLNRGFSLAYWIDYYVRRAIIDEKEQEKVRKWLEKCLMPDQRLARPPKIRSAVKKLVQYFFGEEGIKIVRRLRAKLTRTRVEAALFHSLTGESHISIAAPLKAHFSETQWNALLPILLSLAEFHEQQHDSSLG